MKTETIRKVLLNDFGLEMVNIISDRRAGRGGQVFERFIILKTENDHNTGKVKYAHTIKIMNPDNIIKANSVIVTTTDYLTYEETKKVIKRKEQN